MGNMMERSTPHATYIEFGERLYTGKHGASGLVGEGCQQNPVRTDAGFY